MDSSSKETTSFIVVESGEQDKMDVNRKKSSININQKRKKKTTTTTLYRNMLVPTECDRPFIAATSSGSSSPHSRSIKNNVYSMIDSNETTTANGGCWSTKKSWSTKESNYNSFAYERCKSLSMAIIIMVSLFLLLLPISSMFPSSLPLPLPSSLIQADNNNNNSSQSHSWSLRQEKPLKPLTTNHLSKRTTLIVAAESTDHHHSQTIKSLDEPDQIEGINDFADGRSSYQQNEPESVDDYIKLANSRTLPAPVSHDVLSQESPTTNNSSLNSYANEHQENLSTNQSKPIKDNSISNAVIQHSNQVSFSWKRILTSKCTKTCGGGRLEIMWKCQDQKYNVTVDKHLCIQSGSQEPDKESEDLCAVIDCPPEWVKSDWKGDCNKSCDLTRDVFCAYKDSQGRERQVNDQRCDQTLRPKELIICGNCTATQLNAITIEAAIPGESLSYTSSMNDVSSNHTHNASNSTDNHIRDQSHVEVPIDDNIINMMPAITSSTDSFTMQHGHHRNIPDSTHELKMFDGPVYTLGNWSDCEAPCGGYPGQRLRRVSCMFMQVELPLIDCLAFQKMPETEENCESEPCKALNITNLATGALVHQNDSGNSSSTQNYEENIEADKLSKEMDNLNRFFWKDQGWTQCSSDCLEGTRETLIVCWDPATKDIVEGRFCMSKPKPPIITEVCDAGECNATWTEGPWDECTKECGFGGRRKREVRCEQRVPLSSEKLYFVVSNDICLGTGKPMPATEESCNLMDCKPKWSPGKWGPCLIDPPGTCGQGVRKRTLSCEQEFASKNGPANQELTNELRYAIEVSNNQSEWFPGKIFKVPFEICFGEMRSVPEIDESCHVECKGISGHDPKFMRSSIDSNPDQNYDQHYRRPVVGLKIGGRATLYEKATVKILCKLKTEPIYEYSDNKTTEQAKSSDNTDNELDVMSNRDDYQSPIWRKGSAIIFPPGTDTVNKQIVSRNQTNINVIGYGKMVRLPDYNQTEVLEEFVRANPKQSRFRLNRAVGSMRIKQLQMDDSGIYTCSYGPQTASIVISVKRLPQDREKYTIEGVSDQLKREMNRPTHVSHTRRSLNKRRGRYNQ